MSPQTAQLLLALLSGAREVLRQTDLAQLQTLPPGMKEQIIAEREAAIARWESLAPKQ